ncbi:hypothetical protein P3F01_16320, partial [Clostridium perfringens]|uniref:Uncharacterized protein n=2 Tax=Clostridium perfringens TaxID=1502 RepID=B1BWF8_CLOPF|nr:hypothetical protein [Clostridium perfringens]EDT13972.1 conserved hypothetical protein [Clostridium perfringens E str. JGS1987]EGT3600642.1 hypothetical protein [Clostridium perfringens]MDT9337921.1 hypothetical protein [Clostridium perfringens]MDT9345678.1 hypothetical protein [Clostridium perfringens]MDT9348861.1 hypothetical protein [Clostridium perfringens]
MSEEILNEENKVEEGSIDDFNKNMTLFYGKETGIIRNYSSGRVDLKFYGNEVGDFNYDFIVVPKDDYVLNNLEKFIIKDGQLMRKPDPNASKYPIA